MMALLSADNEGGGECCEMLRLNILPLDEDRLGVTGARDKERWARELRRRDATSIEGFERRSTRCQSGFSGKLSSDCRELEHEGEDVDDVNEELHDSNSSSESAGVTSSPSAPHPMPHATSSTMDIVHRLAIEGLRQP